MEKSIGNNENLEDSFQKLFDLIQPVVNLIEKKEKVRVISHYDTDGIASSSIVVSVLRDMGKEFHLSIVKQVKKKVIERLNKEENDLILFTDLGSGYLDEMCELEFKNLVIIDHHQIEGKCEKDFLHVNPHLVGIGEDEISGSGLAYLLARALNKKNSNLAHLAVIGAIGDIQEEKWTMKGLNKGILEEAINSGVIKKEKGIRLFGRMNRPIHKALEYSTDPFIPGISGNESACIQFLSDLDIELKTEEGKWKSLNDLTEEELKKLASAIIRERIRNNHPEAEEIFGDIYTLKNFPEDSSDVREFSTSINACGRMGQPSIGVLACLNNEEIQERLGGIIRGYRNLLSKYIKWVKSEKENVKSKENAYYIIANDKINENFIGIISSIMQKSLFEDKPVIGFASTEDGEVKVSGRLPDNMENLNLKNIFEKACKEIGGRGGGHKKAAGAFIPKDKIEDFINICEKEF